MLATKLSKSTVPERVYNGHLAVGTTRVQISEIAQPLMTGLLLRMPGNEDVVPNTATVWIGGSNVTANNHATTGGFPMPPGSSLEVSVEDFDDLYFISTANDQDVAWIGI
jgi:hypothetical protein